MNVAPEIGITPTVSLEPHLDPTINAEFNFASNENKITTLCCCCFYRSRPAPPPKELYVNKKGSIEEFKDTKAKRDPVEARLKANHRLAQILKSKFRNDPLLEGFAFDQFVAHLNQRFDENEPITPERLVVIVNALEDLRMVSTQNGRSSPSESVSVSPPHSRSSSEKDEINVGEISLTEKKEKPKKHHHHHHHKKKTEAKK